jgi:IclR family transcriptional regulator, KDG regulon repressor
LDTTLIKGLKVLEQLIRSDTPLGVSALAVQLGLQKSNVHRTLATLMHMRYVAKDGTGAYRPTLRIWEQGARVIAREPLRRAALAFMQSLHQETGETINLVVLEGDHCLFLHQIATQQPLRVTSTVGQRVPAVCIAAGKVLLAHHPDAEKKVRAIAARQGRWNAPKVVKVPALLEELVAARKAGCAYSSGGWREGVNSVAGIILGAHGQAVGALAVSGPQERLTRDRMKVIAKSLLSACTHTANALGAS